MRDLNKEREILAQLYNNDADVIKYLPFFFSNLTELEQFFDIFGGKTLKLPNSFKEYTEKYMQVDKYIHNDKCKGIHCMRRVKPKILESYLNLFTSLEEAIENECNDK